MERRGREAPSPRSKKPRLSKPRLSRKKRPSATTPLAVQNPPVPSADHRIYRKKGSDRIECARKRRRSSDTRFSAERSVPCRKCSLSDGFCLRRGARKASGSSPTIQGEIDESIRKIVPRRGVVQEKAGAMQTQERQTRGSENPSEKSDSDPRYDIGCNIECKIDWLWFRISRLKGGVGEYPPSGYPLGKERSRLWQSCADPLQASRPIRIVSNPPGPRAASTI